jgi:hypothetical protein
MTRSRIADAGTVVSSLAILFAIGYQKGEGHMSALMMIGPVTIVVTGFVLVWWLRRGIRKDAARRIDGAVEYGHSFKEVCRLVEVWSQGMPWLLILALGTGITAGGVGIVWKYVFTDTWEQFGWAVVLAALALALVFHMVWQIGYAAREFRRK